MNNKKKPIVVIFIKFVSSLILGICCFHFVDFKLYTNQKNKTGTRQCTHAVNGQMYSGNQS